MSIRRLFISKSPEDLSTLISYAESKNIEVIAQSLLAFEKVPFKINKPYDLIFFGSPRAVQFFFEQIDNPATSVFAAVGPATAKAIQNRGYSVQFIGQEADILKVANNFHYWCGQRTILFPISDQSLHTVSSLFSPAQKQEILVYKTKSKAVQIEECDLYVFTSPSNIKAFFELNTLPEKVPVVSWGTSTKSFLNELGIPSTVIDKSELFALIELLESLNS